MAMNGKIFHDWVQDFSSLMETVGTEWFWIQVIPGLCMGHRCVFREVPDEWEATRLEIHTFGLTVDLPSAMDLVGGIFQKMLGFSVG